MIAWNGPSSSSWLVGARLLVASFLLASPLPLAAPVCPVRADDAPPMPEKGAAVPGFPPGMVEELTAKSRPSVVVITVPDRDGREKHLGTGFVVGDGLVATNLHVIGEGRAISIRTSRQQPLRVSAIHAFDRNLDLAVLRVEMEGAALAPLELADLESVRDGAPVLALGNPLGLEYSVVSGVVSGRREIEGRDMLQLAMPIEPGNSGGPVLDLHGHVLGVVTMKSLVQRNLGFAVGAHLLKPLLANPNPVPIERWLTIGAIDRGQWTPLFGARWHQRGGRILVEEPGDGFGGRSLCLWHEPIPEVPFEVGAWVHLDDERGAAGLVFHSDGQDRHYGFYPTNGKLRLTRFDGPNVFSWQVLREWSSEHYRPGEWNHLKVRIEADRFLCFVNDQLVTESTDRGLQGGQVGLAKFRETRGEFRQFRLGKELGPSQATRETNERLARLVSELPPLAAVQPAGLDPLVASVDDSVGVLRDQAKQLEQRAGQLRQMASDVRVRKVVARLDTVMRAGEPAFDLLRAALLIGLLDEEDVDIDAYTRQVDRMAEEIKKSLPAEASPEARREALAKYLYQENGFHGSRFDYYHRANSYMNRVIDDRVGLPITLSVLYLELAQRIGMEVEGVGLPGHFIVRQHLANGGSQLIDAFNEGELLDRADAAKILRDNQRRELVEDDLQPASRKQILLRMLGNLRGLAERDGDHEAILRYLEAAIAIDPESVADRGMRAVARFQTGRRDAAVADLDWFLENQPAGLDLDQIRSMRDHFLQRGK